MKNNLKFTRYFYLFTYLFIFCVGDLIAEAELLSIASEIFQKLKNFNHNNCIIRLNHMSLVQGILMYSGIERARHLEICRYFERNKVNRFKFVNFEVYK